MSIFNTSWDWSPAGWGWSGHLELAFIFSIWFCNDSVLNYICWDTSGTPRLVKCFFRCIFFFSFRPRNNHTATSNSRLLQTPEPCANEIWKLKEHSLPLWSPQRRWKIPPELTNRYVKNEAFIVVVFNGILTLLSTTTTAIFSEIVVVVVSNLILTRLAPLSICTLLPIVSVATHLPTAFQYSKDIQISGHLNIWVLQNWNIQLFKYLNINTFE